MAAFQARAATSPKEVVTRVMIWAAMVFGRGLGVGFFSLRFIGIL